MDAQTRLSKKGNVVVVVVAILRYLGLCREAISYIQVSQVYKQTNRNRWMQLIKKTKLIIIYNAVYTIFMWEHSIDLFCF